MNIYLHPAGDSLMNPACFTSHIHRHLAHERALIQRLAQPFQNIVEIGCGSGLNTDLITGHNKNYLGIDINAQRIETARLSHPHNALAHFALADVEDTATMLPYMQMLSPATLIVFPFNAFGNLRCPYPALHALVQHGASVLICSYAWHPHANSARHRYYTQAGIKNISLKQTEDSVFFTGQEGLHSHAYFPHWYQHLFASLLLPCHTIPYGNMGIAFTNISLNA